MVEGTQPLPMLTPAGEVLASTKYGYEIYTKCAALTDTELETHTRKNAKELGLKPFSSDYAAPDSSSKLYLVSLVGMSSEMRETVRKVKIRHETAAQSNEYWLMPQNQLVPEQTKTVLSHVEKQVTSQKPKMGGQIMLKTLGELREVADRLDNQTRSAAESAKQPEPKPDLSAMFEDDDHEDEDDEETKAAKAEAAAALKAEEAKQEAAQALLAGFHDGSLNSAAPKRRKTAQTAQAQATASVERSSGSAMVPSAAAGTGASDKGEGSTSKKQSKMDQEVDKLDHEMKNVALAHYSINNKKNVSVKCLQDLRIENFTALKTDHSKGHAIAGAKKMLDGMEEKAADALETVALRQRYEQCKALKEISEKPELADVELGDLEELLSKLDKVAQHLPPQWRVRTNRALVFQHLSKASDIFVAEEDDVEEAERKKEIIVEHYKNAVEACLPCRSYSQMPWTPSAGTSTNMITEALEELSGLTQAAFESSIGDETAAEKVEAFKQEVTPALEAGNAAKALIMDMLGSKGFRKILRNYETYELHLESFCEATAACLDDAKELLAEWASMDCLPEVIHAFEPELDRLTEFLKFLSNAVFPLSKWMEHSAQDVATWMAAVRKSDAKVEKDLLALINEDASWRKLVDEIIKKSPHAVTMQPRRDRLLESVKQGGYTASRLKEMMLEYDAVRKGMRDVEIEEITFLLQTKLRALAEGIMSKTTEDLAAGRCRTVEINAVLDGLRAFVEESGIADIIASLKSFWSKHQKSLAFNDLLEIAAQAEKDTCNLADLEEILSRCNVADFPVLRDKLSDKDKILLGGLLVSSMRSIFLEAWFLLFRMQASSQLLGRALHYMCVKQKGGNYTVIAVMKRVNLVQKVCHLLHAEDSQPAIAFSKHVEVLKAGVSAGFELRKFKSGGDTATKALDTDKKKTQLMTVVNTYMGLQKKGHGLTGGVATAKEELAKESHETGTEADACNIKILEMVELDTLGLFYELFRDELLSDAISHMCCGASEALHQSMQKMDKCLSGVVGRKSWKATLEEETDLDKVLQLAETTLLRMPLRGKSFFDSIEKFNQELRDAEELVSSFAKIQDVLEAGTGETMEQFEQLQVNVSEAKPILKAARICNVESVIVHILLKESKQQLTDRAQAQGLLRDMVAQVTGNTNGIVREDVHPLLMTAAEGFSEKMECAWGIIYAFDNFGWAVEYILQSINDCKVEGNVDVLCAEAIGDIVFSGTGMMPSVAWAYRDCRQRFLS
ncbi:unnamed protein product [Symbiodinium sp. CCMP2592]|nr:unnamed protein product [Symbiodinium sp. CCMP2592]